MSFRIKLFCHSIVSDWNHGNAHFLRGILTDLALRGFRVESLEPEDSWSRTNLEQERGPTYLTRFQQRYPHIVWRTYNLERDNVEELVGDADVVIVHEWNAPELVASIGELRRRRSDLRVFFHDTHHRAVTAPHEMRLNDLTHYDGILVYGQTLKAAYERLGWSSHVHIWHEAADTRVFKPLGDGGDEKSPLTWIGNWGDEERTKELEEFLIEPIRELNLRATVYGVRYPQAAIEKLKLSGIRYCGYLPNYEAPEVFARHRVTVHVPRRPYVEALAGIPTIRPFEAMACCIPLICSPWRDTEELFRQGQDYLLARTGAEMKELLREVLADRKLAAKLGQNGLATVQSRHTCSHRVDEFLNIYRQVAPPSVGLPERMAAAQCE